MIERYITQLMYDARLKELEEVKEDIYKNNIDSLTCRKMRHEAQGKEWTEKDQTEYDAAYQKCSELIAIEEAKLWNKDEKLVIVSDEEYAKMEEEEEERKKREEEEKLRLLEEQQKNSLLEQIEEVNNGEQ